MMIVEFEDEVYKAFFDENREVCIECATCLHYNTDRQDQPCCTCYSYANWEKGEKE